MVVNAAEATAVAGGVYLLLQLAAYWKAQFMTASIIGGIPTGLKIVEIDAQDGKNVFYLPKNSEYIAVMPSGVADKKALENADEKERKRIKETAQRNTQVILESIGNANRNQLNLQGKIRERTQDIQSKSVDCVISAGSLSKLKDQNSQVEKVTEIYRMLRPGGLFVFVEANSDCDLIDDVMYKVFPKTIQNTPTAGDKMYASANTEIADARSVGGGKKEKKAKGKSGGKRRKRGEQEAAVFEASVKMTQETTDNDAMVLETDTAAPVDEPAEIVTETVTVTEPKTVPLLGKVRNAITFERVQNMLLFPYVTGIAVKP